MTFGAAATDSMDAPEGDSNDREVAPDCRGS